MRSKAYALGSLVVLAAIVSSCGGDDQDTPPDSTVPAATSTTAPVTTTAEAATTTTTVPTLEQPALWPAPEVVFTTPEDAAADFVRSVFSVEPMLGPYAAGDARSGEIEVFTPGEGRPLSRGLLLVRMLGPADGWFVIGAANDLVTITSPEVNAVVPAGLLTVEGIAEGFEGTVILTAFRAGRADAVLDEVVTQGGSTSPEPYRATIDLSEAAPGEVIALVVRAGTGLDQDPGEFTAIPLVIAG